MKRYEILLTLAFVAGAGLWYSQGVSSQVTVAPGAIKAAQAEVIEKRLTVLETENAQLKKELFALKFALTGLDKGVGTLRQEYAAHTHKIEALSSPAGVRKMEESGQSPLIPALNSNQYKTAGGFFTGSPILKK